MPTQGTQSNVLSLIAWIIIAAGLYAITCAIALFLICQGEKPQDRQDAYFDIRNIGVALLWPAVLIGWGVWAAGKRIFKEKKQENKA